MEGKETLEPIVLKRKSNLSQFNVDKNVYAQRDMDYESDGELITDEKFNPTMNLLGSMQNLTPHYDSDKNKWSFYGTIEDLERIAKALSLQDEKTKQIIKVDESSLYNRFDPFWAHQSLWKSVFIEENARYLEPNTPLNELYIRILRGREDIQQPDRNNQSTFDTDRSNLELISPNMEKKKKTDDAALQKKAMKLFFEVIEKPERLDRVLEVLNPVDLGLATTQEQKEALLQTEFVNNNEYVPKYGTSAMKQFIEVCELDKVDLEVYYLAVQAIRLSVVRVSTSDGYSFRGEVINSGSIRSDNDLFRYLKDPKNAPLFIQIEDAIKTAKATK